MEIIRRELNVNDIYSSDLRYNSETDTVQSTTDGGLTWNDYPAGDPRHAAFPPRITEDTACDAAASMVAHMQKILSAILSQSTGTATGIAAGILLLFFPLMGILIGIIGVIVGFLLDLGVEALTTMAEGSDWYTLQCIIRCRLDDNGQLNQAGFDGAQADIDAQIGGTNAVIIKYLMQMAGYGGMNYAASIGTETGDCTACDDCPQDCTFEVYGNAQLDTGMDFVAGDVLDFTASGWWSPNSSLYETPAGGRYGNAPSNYPAPGQPVMSLICKIGAAAWFKVGIGYTGYTVISPGRMYLRANDAGLGDNAGSVVCIVSGGQCV